MTNDGIDLNQALITYGLHFLRKRGFKNIQPPFFMNKDMMAKTAQLDQFDDELYKVICFEVSLRYPSHFVYVLGCSKRRREIPDRNVGTTTLGFPLGRMVRDSRNTTSRQVRWIFDML